MLLHDGARQLLNIFHLEDGEPNLIASVALRADRASGDLLLCKIIVHRNLDVVFGTAVDVGHVERV